MIKIYNLKKIIKILICIAIIICLLMFIKYKSNDNSILTSANSKSTYKILVDVEDSKLFLFENDILIKTYKCSGGKWSTPSPIGTWTIISKAKWGEGFRRKLDGI